MREYPVYNGELPPSKDSSSTFNEEEFLESHRNHTSPEIASVRRELSEAGVYLHLTDLEFESRLRLPDDSDPKEAISTLKKELEEHGYSFLEEDFIARDNYTCYYLNEDGSKSKIVIRNGGDGGYQFKRKGKKLEESNKVVRVKGETRELTQTSLRDAEKALPEGTDPDPALIIRTNKYKLTLCSIGDDGVTRYFRLVTDDAHVPGNEEKTLCRIELEYKGSNEEAEDDPSTIKKEMEKIIKDIRSIESLETDKSTPSKFKWGLQNKSEVSQE